MNQPRFLTDPRLTFYTVLNAQSHHKLDMSVASYNAGGNRNINNRDTQTTVTRYE